MAAMAGTAMAMVTAMGIRSLLKRTLVHSRGVHSMKRYVFAVLVLFALAAPAGAADAANTTTQASGGVASQRVPGGRPQSIFVIQGKACPPGSHMYTGPDEDEIEKAWPGYIYCTFERRYAAIRKKPGMSTKCPDGKDPVPARREGSVIMWCDMPRASFSGTGYLTSVDKAKDRDAAAAAAAASKNKASSTSTPLAVAPPSASSGGGPSPASLIQHPVLPPPRALAPASPPP
jgi:hypothetical protein